nr:hypothetical protein [Kibdelosporangium sp. MJ126-NF4]CTQ99119.1 hypothetical protein [Kibdelosporangium sp. MJ126-NF4]
MSPGGRVIGDCRGTCPWWESGGPGRVDQFDADRDDAEGFALG